MYHHQKEGGRIGVGHQHNGGQLVPQQKKDEEQLTSLDQNQSTVPERPESAPPALELSQQSLFAFSDIRAEWTRIFTDIRCDENYVNFYNTYQGNGKLPPPLEQTMPFGMKYKEDDSRQHQHHNAFSSRLLGEGPFHSSFSHRYGQRGDLEIDPHADSYLSTSPNGYGMSGPSPRRMDSLPLEDFDIPDLSSDSENFNSSEDLVTLLPTGTHHKHAFNNEAFFPPDNTDSYHSRSLWDDSANKGYDKLFPTPGYSTNSKFGVFPGAVGQPIGPGPIQQPQHSAKRSPQPLSMHNGKIPQVNLQMKLEQPKESLQTSPQNSMSKLVCRYFAQGYCSRGDRCNYLHPQSSSALVDQPIPAPTLIKEKEVIAPIAAVAKRDKVTRTKKPSDGADAVRPPTKPPRGPPSPQPKDMPVILPAQTSPTPSPGRGAHAANNKKQGFNLTNFESLIGSIYPVCKDQHGCRFLQKKLEEQNPRVINSIFSEVAPHITELMTDPFGNYLCQKLLEYCDDHQRLSLIINVSPSLVSISQNMHGTRAVQKMIDYLTTKEMIQEIIDALGPSVVLLIKDLNGNHVIQRCLNRLSAPDNQFIYDSVAGHCVEVATHRHGCCVLQRCIDHANPHQKKQLVTEIVANALVLVQDAFGNYVVQYIMELPYPDIPNELVKRFCGHLPLLSTQKFSSNVVEKCLKVGDLSTKQMLINELMEGDFLAMLLQDPFGNYVIQTALGVAEPAQHDALVAMIQPHLTSIRNTPYGKRIQNKIGKVAKSKANGGSISNDSPSPPTSPRNM